MFGVLINNCYVTDGFGKKADVIDDKGFALHYLVETIFLKRLRWLQVSGGSDSHHRDTVLCGSSTSLCGVIGE